MHGGENKPRDREVETRKGAIKPGVPTLGPLLETLDTNGENLNRQDAKRAKEIQNESL
jgi:hypothetical protein